MSRFRVLALLGALSLTACAAEPGAATAGKPGAKGVPAPVAGAPAAPGEAAIRAAVGKAVPGVPIDAIKPAPFPGFSEVSLSGRVVYVSQDGQYLLQGSLVRLADRVDLTEASEAVMRRGELAAVGKERRIVFPAVGAQKHRITVFTDIDCGFCRKLHSQIADYNREGITVEYLFFPRAGLNSESFDKAVAVWCSTDRNAALTAAKLDKPIGKRTCANPVAAEYKLGQKIGVDGTPAIYLDDGTQIGGYLPPKDMLAKLDEHAEQAAKAPAVASN
jgi:thiol:disulfide interchange protein DsbC